jgi:hypothetical protein
MEKRGRENDKIEVKEMMDMIKTRLGFANIPQKKQIETLRTIRKQYFGE